MKKKTYIYGKYIYHRSNRKTVHKIKLCIKKNPLAKTGQFSATLLL